MFLTMEVSRQRCEAGTLTWQTALSPSDTVLLSLRRVGWTIIDAVEWLSDDGWKFNVLDVGAHTIRAALHAAVLRQSWRWAAERPGFAALAEGSDFQETANELISCSQYYLQYLME